MPRILIVEDEAEIREMIRFGLEVANYEVDEAGHAQEARQSLAHSLPDLILMDWMLPGRSGLELTRELKQKPETRDIPLIILTARADESDKVDGLEAGADDYVTKPFSPRELIARIKAVLRRFNKGGDEKPLESNGLRIDPAKHQVTVQNKPLELSPAEYKLLLFFMSHQDRAYSRSRILDHVWDDHTYVEERTVDVHIRRLRKALSPSGHDAMLQTVRSVGYRFSSIPD
ncbi:MAG: phosphate regulon transcriptional regulatory protein PhoB [endosymbiont of Seepiophila jonesi]|uniref:Phosphate regulon transcriptional regulatory protein PhoB n=1 Tax=endosymbiont of Lamellibrachia luymesi TaxID=2200907 RepID=A0A370DUI8_9GAMM|nr:MAG: phosphate regulon transcriptional regulatory protein PhoB [endosymbiont of Lamellibrachia luymesi]RDH89515.1 MAG: phosphate regulon transcriptional regulatory protein PhoB [endosymbiont of Seepiophila jonesi]